MNEVPVVKIKFGSHLYGTNTPSSDTDYKSVHIPSADDILLGRVKKTIRPDQRSKAEGEKNLPEDIDNESYSLDYFFELLASGQTVAIDMLFAPNPEITSPIWNKICLNRDKLLTKKASVFLGYCRQQANKYGIKGSRVAAARAASLAFHDIYSKHGATAKVGEFIPLLVALRNANPDHMTFETYDDPKGIRPTEEYFEVCNRKVPFKASVKLAAEIFTKIFENYGARALQAETNQGVDWKALSHAVRVGEEALELMGTGRITFPLPNASQILAIKRGELEYSVVSGMIEKLLFMVEQAEKVSVLPDEPNYAWIDNFVRDVYYNQILGNLFLGTNIVSTDPKPCDTFTGPIC